MGTIVKFYEPSYSPDRQLTYSVIAARFRGRWIFVRHQQRDTWEIAGGHIEHGESPSGAAERELTEETGAKAFNIVCIATYSVEKEGNTGYGRLFFADVTSLGPVPDISEIAEIELMDHLPENLTYPDIQPVLFLKVNEYLSERQ
jgi:8-oxo-dGTP diphosphatase